MSHSCDEVYEVYNETYPKARKTHTCEACEENIPPGGRYARVFTLFNGTAETYKRCLRCQALHEHLRRLGDYDCWPDERLNCGESYEDEWGALPPEIAALAFTLPGESPEVPK